MLAGCSGTVLPVAPLNSTGTIVDGFARLHRGQPRPTRVSGLVWPLAVVHARIKATELCNASPIGDNYQTDALQVRWIGNSSHLGAWNIYPMGGQVPVRYSAMPLNMVHAAQNCGIYHPRALFESTIDTEYPIPVR